MVRNKAFHPQNESEIAKSIRRSTNWQIFFVATLPYTLQSALDSLTPTPTITHSEALNGNVSINTSNGPVQGTITGTVTHTEVDYEGLRLQQERRQERERSYQQQVAYYQDNAEVKLRAIRTGMLQYGFVAPGSTVVGNVHFKRSVKNSDVAIHLSVDGKTVEFPFSKHDLSRGGDQP